MSSNDPNAGRQPTQEELLAAYEEQMRNVRVEDVLVQSIASMIELGGRRAGLAGGVGERDPAQLHLAIEAVKALKPLAAPLLGPNAAQIDQALSQLQLAYARLAGEEAPAGEGASQGAPAPDGDPAGPLGADVSPKPAEPAAGAQGQQPPEPREPSAVESGKLWIPGR